MDSVKWFSEGSHGLIPSFTYGNLDGAGARGAPFIIQGQLWPTGLHPGLRWSCGMWYSSPVQCMPNNQQILTWSQPHSQPWLDCPRSQGSICWGGVEKRLKEEIRKTVPIFLFMECLLLCQALFQTLENQQFFHPSMELTSWHYFWHICKFYF